MAWPKQCQSLCKSHSGRSCNLLDLSPVIELNGIATLLLLAFCFLLSISFVSRWATICWSFFLIFHNAVGCFSVGLSPALNHIYKDNEPRSLGLG